MHALSHAIQNANILLLFLRAKLRTGTFASLPDYQPFANRQILPNLPGRKIRKNLCFWIRCNRQHITRAPLGKHSAISFRLR